MIPADVQIERLRGAPSLVLWLVQDMGCWVVGSRAGFREDRVTPASDRDILVPRHLWDQVVGALPLTAVVPTRRGGWRIPGTAGLPTIDVSPGDLGDWLSRACTHVAWHPKSGTVVEKA